MSIKPKAACRPLFLWDCDSLKVVFSRKGVDSAAGGCASATIDGRPFSLPIPTAFPTPTRYGDLAEPFPALAADLSNGRLSPDRPCHLDPDIARGSLRSPRGAGWRGAIGQIGAALSHLRNAGIGPGDLFLFWGLYRACARNAGRWRPIGPKRHGIFGWLQVAEAVELGADGGQAVARYPWLERHPHARAGWPRRNTVFVARDRLGIGDGALPGYGVFNRLIPLSCSRSAHASVWQVPAWLDRSAGGVGLTYHPRERWLGGGRLASAHQGQEFVADIGERADARDWLCSLFHASIEEGGCLRVQ